MAISDEITGAFIGIFGSTLSALGLVLQKYSHVVNVGTKRHYVLQRWWVCGFCIFILAQIINMVPMAMTPQLVTACLGSWTMVCNTIFARLLLKETLKLGQTVAIVGLVLSTAMVIINTPDISEAKKDSNEDVLQIGNHFLQPSFLALTGFYLCVITVIRMLAFRAAPCGKFSEESNSDGLDGESNSWALAVASYETFRDALVPASWAVCAAICVGYTALLFRCSLHEFVHAPRPRSCLEKRCVAGIIAGSVSGLHTTSPWLAWQTYVIIVAAFICAPTELHCLNLALSLGDAVSVVSTYMSLGILTQLSMGACFFQELKEFTSMGSEVFFSIGVLLTLIFVIVMTLSQSHKEEGDQVHLLRVDDESGTDAAE